jgi:hypothetical protein
VDQRLATSKDPSIHDIVGERRMGIVFEVDTGCFFEKGHLAQEEAK